MDVCEIGPAATDVVCRASVVVAVVIVVVVVVVIVPECETRKLSASAFVEIDYCNRYP